MRDSRLAVRLETSDYELVRQVAFDERKAPGTLASEIVALWAREKRSQAASAGERETEHVRH